jgi:predicted secreted protein
VVIGWSVSQQLRLQSTDIDSLTTLVGRLQEQLRVNAMSFAVSPEKRDEVAAGLITEALENFSKKAGLIAETLGAKDYRIVSISVGESRPPHPYRQSYQTEAMSVKAGSAPQVEAGESKIVVRADGSIQLNF